MPGLVVSEAVTGNTARFIVTAIVVSLFASSVMAADKIVLQLRWEPQFQFAGYYAALWQGFYAEAGLEVDIRSAVQPDRSVLSATREVAEGRAHFGVGAADILTARDKGAPLTVAAVIFQQSPVAVFARKDANVTSPADLTHLRVRRVKTDASDAEFVAMLNAEGIDSDTIKSHLPGNWDGQTSVLLAENKLDAFVGYTLTALWRAKIRGVPLTILRPAAYGVDFYGDTIFTTERFAEQNPELVTRFIAATRRGWEYALQHAESVATRIGRDIPRTFKVKNPVAFNLFQIKEVRKLMLYPIVQIGHVNPNRWRRMHLDLKQAGLVSGELDLRSLVFDPVRDAQIAQRNWVFGLMGAVGLASVLLFGVFIWNRSLRQTVAVRTTELKQLNLDLEHRVEKRTEELREAQGELVKRERLATLGQLAATVSHELRNPLGVIRTSAYLLHQGLPGDNARMTRALDRIVRGITRCDRIIDELLDFTRMSAPEAEPTELDAWLETVLDEQQLSEGVTLQRDLSLDGLSLAIDPERMRRAIINVLDNACQAMSEENEGGEKVLTVSTAERNGRIEIVVEDTGPGMLPEVHERVFEPLFSTKNFGVGLGMSIVREIMEQHSGGIDLETDLGRGTRVCLWFDPRTKAPETAV